MFNLSWNNIIFSYASNSPASTQEAMPHILVELRSKLSELRFSFQRLHQGRIQQLKRN